jgi:hypothetical protein
LPENEPESSDQNFEQEIPKKPSKVVIGDVMRRFAQQAQACAVSEYSTGTVQLRITVLNNGAVESSTTVGSFANTATGKCVETIAKNVEFPEFEDPSFTFTYPVTLR